jgi:DnaJ homolog subfamily C member 7
VKTTLLFNVEGIASEAMPSMMPTQSSSRAESVADTAPALRAEEEKRRSLMAAAEHDHAAGNAAFQQANFEQAIRLYTRAAEAIRPYPAGHEKLAVLLSNRAAALLALRKPLQALSDCRMALQYSPSFLKCGLRMATCYCRLGQLAEATASVQKVLDSPLLGTMAEEASRKMQEIKQLQMELATVLHMLGYELSSLECLPETATTWQKLPPLKEAFTRLESLQDRIPHAEYWHAARSEVLLRLCKFTEAVQATKMPQHKEVASDSHLATGTPWRCWLCAQAAYFQGEPMKAKELLQALRGVIRQQDSQCFPSGRKRAEESILEAVVPIPTAEEIETLLETLDEMEIMRQRGKAAVTAGKYDGALKAYSDALAVGTLSPCLAAVFHSNRAAAHQGLGNVALALADCCIARALSPKYPKAHSRLAGLLAEVGMHSAAIDVLSALLEIPGLSAASKRDYAARLATERQAASLRPAHAVLGAPASAPPVNHYKLLGVERRCATGDVRKAFKRLSLNLHPDKSAVTCRIASRWGTVGSCVMLEDTARRVADGATWLFKCIGEAHEVLADASKRAELDAELDAATSARFSPSGNRDRFWHRYGQPASSRWYYQYQ